MGKQTVEVMVEGGKATAGPPIGTSLGPLGINVAQVVEKINEKTRDLEGMQVPVKVTVDTEKKTFDVEVGSPPVSALLKKELSLEKGSAETGKFRVGDLSEEQVAKIARAKFGSDDESFRSQVKGTCRSMGITIGQGEVTEDELKAQEAEKARIKAEEEAKEEAAKLREAGLAPEAGAEAAAPEGAEGEAKEGAEAPEGTEAPEEEAKPPEGEKPEGKPEGKKEEKKE